LLRLFALGLDLPASYFDAAFVRDVTQFAYNFYPTRPRAEPEEPATEPLVIGPAHADSGGLTVLHQRGTYEGLQVLTLDGDWVAVPVVPDAFVINIGELMHRWTNGVCLATVHRVVAGPSVDDQRESIVTFLLPEVDTVIAPLPSTVDVEGPRFEPVTPYDWEGEYLQKIGFAPASRDLVGVTGAE
jgi:isopenicillin N synthase-like dioxygenase